MRCKSSGWLHHFNYSCIVHFKAPPPREALPLRQKKSGASVFFSDVHRECLKNAAGIHPQRIDCITEETERLISFGRTILQSATKAPITSDIARAAIQALIPDRKRWSAVPNDRFQRRSEYL